MNFKYLREHPEIVQENISLVYDQSTWEMFGQAARWYPTAQKYVIDFAEEFGKSEQVVAGIISVLSPQKSWEDNLVLSYEFLDTKGKRCRHIGQQADKARKIYKYKGDDLTYIAGIIRGMKTTNFFYNILNPEDENWVTLDVHMCQLMTGNMDYKVATDVQYAFLKEQFINFSLENMVVASTMQALLWLTWKKIKPRGLEKTNILHNLV